MQRRQRLFVFFSQPQPLRCCLRSNPPNFVAGTSNGSARQPSPLRTEEYTEHLYQTERPVRYKPGTCIIYRLDAWCDSQKKAWSRNLMSGLWAGIAARRQRSGRCATRTTTSGAARTRSG